MIFELVGSRMLAPYFGTSLVVWTNLIGVILGCLSLGYWLGGKLADKKTSLEIFSLMILISAIFIGLTNFTKIGALNFFQKVEDIKLGSLLATISLFTLPSIILGMISPYAVKLAMTDFNKAGVTVGRLYAISTLGSIIGTFLAGFFLIPYFGNTKIIFLLLGILFFCSVIICPKKFFKLKAMFIFIFLFSFLGANFLNSLYRDDGFIDIDTQYNRVLIYDSLDKDIKRKARYMVINNESSSAMYLDNDDLVFQYTKFYDLARHFNPDFKKALLLGGAAYSYPKYYLKNFPSATIDVVEIDPGLTELAKKYFRLEDNPRLQIFHEDGRVFLNKTRKKYDVIFGDAFASFYSLPYQLTTREAIEKMYGVLDDNGIVIVNIISAMEGRKGEFLRSEYATYKNIFPQVYLFPVQEKKDGNKVQNIILVALKAKEPPGFYSDVQELNEYLEHLWKKEVPEDLPILTDEYAPVDYYINKIM